MRKDMAKVFHERPRGGARFPVKTRLKINPQAAADEPPDSKMTKPVFFLRRVGLVPRFSHPHYKPLVRFLKSRVGQKWDDIYSEALRVLDRRSPVSRAVFEWLRPENGLITFACHLGTDGQIYENQAVFRDPPRLATGFLVHPVSKILLEIPRVKTSYQGTAPPIHFFRMDGDWGVVQLDGVWYEISYANVTAPLSSSDICPVLEFTASAIHNGNLPPLRPLGQLGFVVISFSHKRQLGKRQLRKYKLTNCR